MDEKLGNANSWWETYEEDEAALKKNRKKLAVDPARREPGETLRSEFEGSMKKLLPLSGEDRENGPADR